MNHSVPCKRVLLKLSGELLAGPQGFGISQEASLRTAQVIQSLSVQNVQLAIVIGGGNIFRGIHLEALGMPRPPADQMGMLATIINGIALQHALISLGCKVRVFSGLQCPQAVESYSWQGAMECLASGSIALFAGGTGNSYFSTDTAAALRACEIRADVLLKATKVDGIYDKDPVKHADAKKYDSISYGQILAHNLQVMDPAAVALCRSGEVPILVFNMAKLYDPQLLPLLRQQKIGTLVTPG